MKVLIVATYLYIPTLKGFNRNKTGFGILLNQFTEYIGKRSELYFFSNVITPEVYHNNSIIVRHTWWDIISNISRADVLAGIKSALKSRQSFRNRLRYIYYRINCGALRATICQIRPDVIHCQGVGEKYLYYLKTCFKSGIPVVNTLHGLIGLSDSIKIDPEDKASELEYLNFALMNDVQTSVISTGILWKIQKSYQVNDSSLITVIPNGTKKEDQPIKYNIREKYGIPTKNKVILSVGSVCERKNQIQIVRSLAKLPAEIISDITLLLLGAIQDGYNIQDVIIENELTETVICCGFVEYSKISSFYLNADLNILASIDEGFGLSMIEGFLYGVPCLCYSDLDAVPDIYDECAMFLCDQRTDIALSNSIKEALEKSWNSKLIEEHGRKFSLENMADKYIKFYGKAISKHSINNE